MGHRWSRRRVLRRGALATAVGVAGCVSSLRRRSPEEQVREHEETLEQFSDVETAIEEGYRTSGSYVRTDAGVLGIPFINPNVRELGPEKPQAILYGLSAEAQYEALGLKWFAPATEYDSAPSLFGKEFEGPRPGETALVPEHYALHVWLFQENPDGLFALYNPAVESPNLVDQIEPVRDRLRDLLVGKDALENGYENTERCIATDDGGYGIPFVKADADRSGGTDPNDPPILLYQLTTNWSYQLMGAEWYVPTSEAPGPPRLFGRDFHAGTDGHSPATDQPEHYGLHAWLFRANPRGLFATYNPTVVC